MLPPTRRRYLRIVACCVFASVLPAAASAESLRDQLVGEWVLVSAKNTSSTGVTRDLFGPDPKGILILERSGRYAQVQVRPGRPEFKAGSRSEGTAEENASAVRGAYASFGKWSVDEAKKTFTRSIAGSATFPNEEGKDTIWSIDLAGGELRLHVPASSAGGSTQLLLQRAQ